MGYLNLYHRYWTPFRSFLPKPAQRFAARAAKAISEFHPRLPIYADIIDRAARDREHFWSGAMVFWESQKEKLVDRGKLNASSDHKEAIASGALEPSYLEADTFNVMQSFFGPLDRAHPGADALTRMIHSEFRLRLPELLLMRVDKIGMSVSLEARVPFLDHRLVEFTMDIPEAWKTKNGEPKYLLKKAVEGLIPNEIIYRKKMGFAAPMSHWLRSDFGRSVKASIMSSGLLQRGFFDVEYVCKLFDWHMSGRADCSLQIWTLYNVAAWYDFWIDRKQVGAYAA
jgi:asparagine synthase (glutamine-hydrolysing)